MKIFNYVTQTSDEEEMEDEIPKPSVSSQKCRMQRNEEIWRDYLSFIHLQQMPHFAQGHANACCFLY